MAGDIGLLIFRRDATVAGTSILAKCKRIVARDFPDEQPELFLEITHRVTTLLMGEIEAVSVDETILPEDRVRRVRSLLAHIHQIAEWVRFADGADSSQTPWSVVGPLRRFFASLCDGAQFIVRPKWHWNYEIRGDIPKYFCERVVPSIEERDGNRIALAELRKCLERLGQTTAIISFPYTDRKNVLRHVLFAHEIGHIISDRTLEKYWTEREDDIKRLLAERLRSKLMENPALAQEPDLSEFLTITQLERAHWLLRRAAEEILADHTAVWLFGPIAVLAAYEVGVQRHMDIQPSLETQGYPPWRLRLHLMIRECKPNWPDSLGLRKGESEFVRCVAASASTLWGTVKEEASIELRSYSPLQEPMVSIVYDYLINTLLPEVIRDQKALVAGAVAPITYDTARLAELLERLRHDIPPNNVRARVEGTYSQDVPDLREIFLAGWLYYVHQLLSNSAYAGDRDAQDRLHRLLLKAIESAELEQDYRHWKGRTCLA